ncbi:MAG TPA: hypothetical protein VKT82_02315 [Ktedonobacterales bacterium]|nr:hypothetical protein [Ktedonobacterales bacterium]
MATVGPTCGGGFRINLQADVHDGLLGACFLAKPSKLRVLRVLGIIRKGQHHTLPEITLRRVRSGVLESRALIFAHPDGEVITATCFEVTSLPGALRVRTI